MNRKPTSTGKFKCAKCSEEHPRVPEESTYSPGTCWRCCDAPIQPFRGKRHHYRRPDVGTRSVEAARRRGEFRD